MKNTSKKKWESPKINTLSIKDITASGTITKGTEDSFPSSIPRPS